MPFICPLYRHGNTRFFASYIQYLYSPCLVTLVVMKHPLFTLISVVTLCSANALAQNTAANYNSKGDDYYYGRGVAQDYAAALTWYRKAANEGYALAEYNIGYLYEKGLGVLQNDAEAVVWFTKAAGKNHVAACNSVGWHYKKGKGVTKDYIKALQYLEQATDLGNKYAPNHLGHMYDDGEGVPSDYAKAMYYFRLAAQRGNVESVGNIGWLFDKGRGVAKNEDSAVKYYTISAEAGEAFAQNNLGVILRNRGQYAEAIAWLEQADEKGNKHAPNTLGKIYEKGQGVDRNYSRAVQYYRVAVARGNNNAMANLGWAWSHGYGMPANIDSAIEWYTRAARAGVDFAQNNLGNTYLKQGKIAAALDWTQKAANQQYAPAWANLGWYYENGFGMPKDINHARDLYRKAAMAGDDCGQNNYGHLLAKDKRYDEALSWFRLSAAQEYGLAYANIAWMYENAFGAPRNLDSAVWYARKARGMGVSAGQFRMGWLFEKGWGLPQSYDSALHLYKLAAQDNYGAAECNLGVMYAKGRIVRHNDTTAIALYRRAIVHNSVRAKNNLGWMHENGFGLPRNCDSAIALYREAAAAEDTFAIANLKRIERDGCLQGVISTTKPTAAAATKTNTPAPRLMKVYPNPNYGHFTVELPEDVTEPAEMTLYDMQGAVVYQTTSDHAGKTLYIDVTPGMYVLRVMTNAEKWTERVQINR